MPPPFPEGACFNLKRYPGRPGWGLGVRLQLYSAKSSKCREASGDCGRSGGGGGNSSNSSSSRVAVEVKVHGRP